MTAAAIRYIDGDAHFYEPIEIFSQYCDPAIRDDVPQWRKDEGEGGALRVQVGTQLYPSRLTHPAGLGWVMGEDSPFLKKQGAHDPIERLKFMDSEGVEAEIIYPTLGMQGFSAIEDPQVAGGLCRAYNRWAAEFAAADPRRLWPAMLLPMNHPEVARAELAYARDQLGLGIAFANPTPVPGLHWSHPDYDVFWAAAQDLDVVFTFHEGSSSKDRSVGGDRYEQYAMRYVCGHVVEIELGLMDVLLGGVCERFPRLTIGLVEAHVAWLPGWLAILDDQFPRVSSLFTERGGKGPLSLRPSEYFQRQCFIVAFPDDTMLKEVTDRVGDDRVIISSDYPHPQTRYDLVKTLHETHPEIGPDLEAKLLHANASAIFGTQRAGLPARVGA